MGIKTTSTTTPLTTTKVCLNPNYTIHSNQYQLSLHPLCSSLILLCTDTLDTLNHFLLRASIFVEHPQHQFKSFSIEEFNSLVGIKEYHGHNLSLTLLSQFYLSTQLLLPTEQLLKHWLIRKKILPTSNSTFSYTTTGFTSTFFYLIGWVQDHLSVASHELHHAIYYFHDGYQRQVKLIWNALPSNVKRQLISYLASCKYKPSLYEDEFQAHLGNNEIMILAQDKLLNQAKQQLENVKKDYIDWFDCLKNI